MIIADAEILGARVLIVDDQPANVSLLEHMLREAGYTCVGSTMAPESVCALHRTNRYDLILLDLQMPGMDGFAVMEGLKTNTDDDYLPVLVITAQPGHKLRALRAGARDFVSKPFDLVEVRTRIRNLLEVRLLYRKLGELNQNLEDRIEERTAELRESEARFRSLTDLASDWYWEQDQNGTFTRVSGPVLDMLGLRVETLEGHPGDPQLDGAADADRATLLAFIEARQPFLDHVIRHIGADGTPRRYQVSGEPMFDAQCRFIGYRGVGIQLDAR